MFVNFYIKSKTKWKKKRIGKRCKIYDFLNLKFIKNQSKINQNLKKKGVRF